ncbi:MAG: hypothetical protein JWN94_4484 [Betaproteobacteria bacterium]|nr:hypothetical protein [Betaproteobacteria bacterium]
MKVIPISARASILIALLVAVSGTAGAKLPPPTPEEVASATAEAEQAKAQAAVEQARLTRSQDRVVSAYQAGLRKRGITPPTPTPVAQTEQKNLPMKAVEPPRSTGPHGGTTPSAESHSGNAK